MARTCEFLLRRTIISQDPSTLSLKVTGWACIFCLAGLAVSVALYYLDTALSEVLPYGLLVPGYGDPGTMETAIALFFIGALVFGFLYLRNRHEVLGQLSDR